MFVHAGLPQIPLDQIDLERDRSAMLWTRGKFLKSTYDWGKVVVHGHTRVTRAGMWPNRINIDTGCVYEGQLTAIALPGEVLFCVGDGGGRPSRSCCVTRPGSGRPIGSPARSRSG